MATVYEIVTESIIKQLESGAAPWRKPWRTEPPANLISGKEYRGINIFLLAFQGYGSRYWLTYRQALALGGNVKKGQRGTSVVFWKIGEYRKENNETGETEDRKSLLLRYYTVFNVEQCTGIEAPAKPVESTTFHPIEHCEQVVANMPNPPALSHNEGRAFYRPSTDSVSIPRPTLFNDPAEYYSTLFHELGHATGHASRLDRPGITESHFFGDRDYSKEELVAEMASAFLCGHCGIERTTLDNSAAYIGGWLKKLRDDKRLVVTAAAQGQKAADYVLGRKAEQAEPVAAE